MTSSRVIPAPTLMASDKVKHGIAALLVTLSILAAGCNRIESVAVQDTRPKKAGLTTLKMNFLPNLTYSAFMIGKEEGYFEQEGIDAQLVSIDGKQLPLAAVSGELDVISMPISPGTFNTIHRTHVMQIVADKGHSAPGPCIAEGFAAPPAMADQIRRTGSVKGLRFLNKRAGHVEYMIDLLLARQGLSRNDIRFADIDVPEYLGAAQNKVDAVIYTSEPRLSKLRSEHLVEVVVTAEDLDPGHQFSVVLFGKRLLHDDPELGRRFMRAYLRAVRQYNEGNTDRNVAIISKYTNMPAELIKKTCWVAISDDGRVRPESVRGFMDWALKHGYLDAPVPVSEWWNGSYIDAAGAGKAQ